VLEFVLEGTNFRRAAARQNQTETQRDRVCDLESGFACARAQGRTIWIADAHRDDGKRYVARADEILTAFLELERIIRAWRNQAAAKWC
jgi:hypothetical protein